MGKGGGGDEGVAQIGAEGLSEIEVGVPWSGCYFWRRGVRLEVAGENPSSSKE